MSNATRKSNAEEFGYGGVEPLTVQMPHDIAWLVTQKVCPGPSFMSARPDLWEKLVTLRQKVHEVLFSFESKPQPKPGEPIDYAPIYITTDEAWMLDQIVPFDGLGGECCKFLMSLYRGLYARAKDIPIEMLEPIRKSDDPLPDFDFDLKKDEPPTTTGSDAPDLGKRDITDVSEPDDDLLAAT